MTDHPAPMHADDTLSPVDLPGGTVIGGHPLRWASAGIAVAAAFLLMFNAVAIDAWANELPPGPYAARLTALTARWVTLTDRAGLGAPRALLHERWKRAEAATFAG